jgi:hypothetical protein
MALKSLPPSPLHTRSSRRFVFSAWLSLVKTGVYPIYIIQQAISLSGYSGIFDFFNILIAG